MANEQDPSTKAPVAAGPWSKYSEQATSPKGPWSKYAGLDSTNENQPSRSLGAVANDTVIEVANAAASGVSSAANFVQPGNSVSKWIDKNIVESGEAKQSDVVKAEKQKFRTELDEAKGVGDELAAVGKYVVNNPLLTIAQAAGSFVGPGAAVKGAGAIARGVGAGTSAATKAGRAGGVAAGAAMAGGDAAGTAHELSSKAGATEEQAVAAGREASVIPAIVGGLGGAFGAEKLLAGAKGFAGGTAARALKTGASEALQEGIEEGVTQYEGQRAAMPYDSKIDPMKGVAGAAGMGAVMGAGTGGVVGALESGHHTDLPKPTADAASDAAIPQAGFMDGVEASPRVDYLADVQKVIRGGTEFSTQQTVDTVRSAMEDAWLAQHVGGAESTQVDAGASGVQAAEAVGQQLQTEFDQAGEGASIASVDARIRTSRILEGLQNILDSGVDNSQQVSARLNESLARINEDPLQPEEVVRVRRMTDSFMGYKGVGQTAPLPTAPPKYVDENADNGAMEALIPERKSKSMGLRHEAKGLEGAAALAVDSGATDFLAQAAAAAQQADSVTPPADTQAPKRQALTAEETAGLASTLAGSDLVNTPINHADLEQLQAKLLEVRQRAADNGSWNVPLMGQRRRIEEAIGKLQATTSIGETQTTSQGSTNVTQADQTQQATPQQAPAGAGKAAQPAVQDLNGDGAANANNGAQTPPTTGAGQEAPADSGRGATLRKQLNDVEAKILEAAPNAMSAGGGDIEAAMKSRKVPVTLKAQRKKLQEQLRAAQATETKPFAPETGTLGIPRADMPQVSAQAHGGLVKHLNAQGIAHETGTVNAADLKPTQAEYSPAKLEAAKAGTGDRAVIVSNDGHIIDGHHQAMAAAEEGKTVKAIVLDAPVEQALAAVKNSPSAQGDEQKQPAAKKPRGILAKKAARDTDSSANDQKDAADTANAGVNPGATQNSAGAPVDRAVMDMAREGRASRDILRLVAGTSKSRFNRNVARLLLNSGVTPTVQLQEKSLGGGDGFTFLAKYSRRHDQLTLTPAAQTQAEQIFMHEMIHAATLKALDRKGIASLQMRRLFEHVKKQGGAAGQYGMKNVGEFVAEAFSNKEFQRALKSMDAPSGSTLKSAWDGFVRILKRVLGLPMDSNDALSRALELGVAVMREDMAIRARGERVRGGGDAFALSQETRTNFDARIDALFNGGKAVAGTRVLDRSDVMGLLGHPSVPLMLNERHLLDGLTNHPEMTAAAWKKVPQWIESPAMVYSDPRDTGRLVVIAPETVAGYPIMLVVEPNAGNAARGKGSSVPIEQLLVTVYAKTGSKLPSPGYLASSGHLLYVDTKNAPEVLQRAGVQFPGQAALQQGRKKILTEKHLNGWRKANSGDAHAGVDPNSAPSEDDAHFGVAEARALKSNALDQLQQAFTHEGKVSAWDKSVGTMRHLAERAPIFKPVFEAAQRHIDDVSTLANDAADAAPRLLPRVDSLGDIVGKNRKSPVSAADNKAVAKPLFEGTLLWGRDVDGKPALARDLEAKYASLPADEKAKLMLKAGRIDPGVLRMWQGQPQSMYEAAVNARFASTLLKAGVVWSDAELKSLFKTTDQQASLYREARAGIDRSIDITSRADMLRVAGEEYAHMRDAVLDAPTMTDAFTLLTDMMELEAKANPDLRDRIADTVQLLRNRFDSAEKLQKEGYAPLQRFGRYTVDVVDQHGERQYFGMFESMREANLMKLRMQSAFAGATVTSGTMSDQAYKLFQGLTPETMEQFGEMLGLKSSGNEAQDKAFQTYLKLAKNNQSALKRLIHRQGIAGYSEDVGRVLANFVYSNARLGSGGLNAGAMDKAIGNIPKEQGELRDVAMGLRSYIQDPQEEGQAIRGMLFAQYLGGSVASAFVNMMQPFQISMPWLSQFGGIRKAGVQMARALKDMGTKGFKYEVDLAHALYLAEEDGTVSPQEIHALMAQARGAGTLRTGDGTKLGDARATASNAWEKGKVLWGQPFALAEQFNRRLTFIASYRTAKEQGMADPGAFARKAVLETQFLYSKANKPRWARGAVGGTLFTFKTYSVSYLELMHRMWNQGGKEGKRAVAWSMVGLLLMGGAGGLPFMEDLEDLVDGIAQLMGYNVSAKQWRKEAMRDVIGKEMAEFVEQGLSGLPGAPIDVSGRLGLGNLIPGTGLFLSKPNRERDLLEVVGPAGDLISRGFSGARKLVTGDVGGAALEVSPTAVRNAAKGIDMAVSGMYKDTKGYKVLDTTLPEAAAKFIGFQPKSVAEVQEGNSFMLRSRSFYAQQSSEIKAQWADALFRKDEDAVKRARERLTDWNRDNPDQQMVVKLSDVWKKAREMGKDRTERIAATAPKALRQQMRSMAGGISYHG